MQRRQLLKGLVAASVFTITGFGWKDAPTPLEVMTGWSHPNSDPLADIKQMMDIIRNDSLEAPDTLIMGHNAFAIFKQIGVDTTCNVGNFSKDL